MCPSLRSFQPTRPTDLIQLERPLKFDASPEIGAFSSTIIHYFTALNSLTSRDCATFQTNRICSVEAQAVCSARGDANSHGNDEWENDHEVRIVKSQYTSPP